MTGADWGSAGFAWADVHWVRDRLAAGADPNATVPYWGPVLHTAARWGGAESVAELAALADDVDIRYAGRTALWVAVHAGKPDCARVLAAAGADPCRSSSGTRTPAIRTGC